MSLETKPPTTEDSCFSFAVGRSGVEMHPAYLTYRLTGPEAPARDLLLVKRTEKTRLPRLLSDRDFTRLNMFERQLQAESARRGRIGTQKSIVNSIYDGAAPFDELHVVVHRLGPVPAYVLPDCVRIKVHDQVTHPRSVDAYVGIYQDTAGHGHTKRWPGVFRNRVEFLSSLRDLPTLFRRYFEDISERLFDIQHHLPLDKVTAGCRTAIEEIRVSIDKKLEIILKPEKYENEQPDAARFARALGRDYSESIALSQCYRTLVLCLIHRLLRMFCIRDTRHDAATYVAALLAMVQEGGSEHQEDATLSPDHVALQRISRLAISNDPEMHTLNLDAGLPPWVIHVLEFARFISLLESEQFMMSRPSIFLSAQHRVPSPETLRRLFAEQLGESLKYVQEEVPGTVFLPLITSRIWQSDSTLAVVPLQRQDLGGTDEKGLNWVVRELDYADALAKRIVALVESRQDVEKILESLKGERLDRLVPRTRPKPKRRSPTEAFATALTELVPWYYTQKSLDQLDANLVKGLSDERRRGVDARTESLVKAILRYVAKDDGEVYALKRLHQRVLNAPLKVEDLAPHVFPGMSGKASQKHFTRLMGRVRERIVRVGRTELQVVDLKPGTRSYRTNLPRIVALLRTDLTEQSAILRLLDHAIGRAA